MTGMNVFSEISGVLLGLAFIPYISAIVQKRTKPMILSWVVWAILDGLSFWGMWKEGALNGQIVAALFGAVIVCFLTLIYGKWEWDATNIMCIVGAAISVTMLLTMENAAASIAASSAGIFVGSMPTFKSAWHTPEHENTFSWMISTWSSIFAVFSIEQWAWSHALQPCTMLLISGIMICFLLRPRTKPHPQ